MLKLVLIALAALLLPLSLLVGQLAADHLPAGVPIPVEERTHGTRAMIDGHYRGLA